METESQYRIYSVANHALSRTLKTGKIDWLIDWTHSITMRQHGNTGGFYLPSGKPVQSPSQKIGYTKGQSYPADKAVKFQNHPAIIIPYLAIEVSRDLVIFSSVRSMDVI